MATVQVGEYEMIFDHGGSGSEEMGGDASSRLDANNLTELTPIVASDVVASKEPMVRPEVLSSKQKLSTISSALTSSYQTPVSEQDLEMDRGRLRSRPPTNSTYSAEVTEALARMDQEVGPPRKRGRPKGWKPGMSYAEMRGNPPPPPRKSKKPLAKSGSGTPVNGETKKRGRPHKDLTFSMRETYLKSTPRYIPFGCVWHDEVTSDICPAELQNMETLRRHIYFVHGDMDPLICRWGKCAKQEPPTEYVDEDAFRLHMEEAHLESYMWHMGDGIQNNGIWTLKQDPNKLPDYLFDKDGNQVTPSIHDQQLEDHAGMLERKRKLREIRRLAEENAPTEKEYLKQILGHSKGLP
ncbi:uncharacterized protein JN550_007158 [Neoarthrinium moseri]|uniref:uncharacterized protein n=1 Tax=Neoarthrinium moseri TaxID=1658444 RepID=UPI001FDB7A63|nr:uncharacterized protein JN550_007158 [Neoarthrinium moseri]KAI1867106.1 hypothetical protein JN550_007158 [Neoarthrinium moseri]